METQATPDFLISQMRVLNMPEMTYFYMTNKPTAFANLDRDFDPLLASIYAAKVQANITEAWPELIRYYKADAGARTGEPDLS